MQRPAIEAREWRIINVRKFWNDGLGDHDVCDIACDGVVAGLPHIIAQCVDVHEAELIITQRLRITQLEQQVRNEVADAVKIIADRRDRVGELGAELEARDEQIARQLAYIAHLEAQAPQLVAKAGEMQREGCTRTLAASGYRKALPIAGGAPAPTFEAVLEALKEEKSNAQN